MRGLSGLEPSDEKVCRDCLISKPLTDFSPAKKNRDGRTSYCKPCMTARTRSSYRKRVEARGSVVRVREELPAGMRRCPDCGSILPLEEFPLFAGRKNGRGTYCKPCHNARGKATYTKLYGSTREYHLRRRYGITGAQYDAMVEAQGNLCALCRERPPEHVDHDHVTGVVRGVLCSCCNQGLGNFRDNVAALRAAIVYLERTTWQRHRVRPGVFRLTSPRPEAAPSPSSSELQRLISSRRG